MRPSQPNHIWQKSAAREWVDEHETELSAATAGAFAVIERAGRKRLLVQAPCTGVRAARALVRQFGGAAQKLPRDWLTRYTRAKAAKPIRIGARLAIADRGPARDGMLVVPAGAAFGTGEHATTAMSLRMLERVTRKLAPGWRMFDAGTGSGILALAAARFGAGEVLAVDNDAMAIATAKGNARRNEVRNIRFIVADVKQATRGRFAVITANLYSELLQEMLPRFRKALSANGLLILSGVMRAQEPKLVRALRRNGIEIEEVRRRGKWVALLARSRSYS